MCLATKIGRTGKHKSPANRGVFVTVQLVGGHNSASSNTRGVERAEAEAIYDAGREAVVEVLLAMDRRIQQLEARVAEA